MNAKGVFSDVVGLSYRCGRFSGFTTEDFAFEYETNQDISFAIGDLDIGRTKAKDLITLSDLAPKDASDFDSRLVNRARLLFSLSPGQGFENPIIIDKNVREVVNSLATRLNLDDPDLLALDKPLEEICAKLNLQPKTVSHARNHIRREIAGFKVLRDIRIPCENNQYVLGDVYLPLKHQRGHKYPVLVTCTLYGRRVFHSGPDLESFEEIQAFEKAEDDWHSKSNKTPIQLPRDSWGDAWDRQRGFESIAAFNTFSYVPRGYAMLKIDPAGVSQTPGARGVPGQIVADYHAAIEWAADQDWSDGNVGLVGSSYGANTQWAVASLRPKGLRCFVPFATDIDTYRDAVYPGGIPASRYITDWFARVQRSSPRWQDHMNVVELMNAHPFYEPLWDIVSSKIDQLEIPCFLAASQIFIIHGRGAYEAWRARHSDNTHLQMVDCNYYPWPSRESSSKILQFLDKTLKGIESHLERVGIQMRLGHKLWYWRKERDWPVPGTIYTKWHLGADATLSEKTVGHPEIKLTYPSRAPSFGKSGLSFFSTSFERDVELAGHFVTVLSISASTVDADVVATLWAIDDNGRVVPYGSAGQAEPIAKGFLRASHRKLDAARSLPERPWHTHTKNDYQPLCVDEVVELQIEMFPAAARIRSGWKLRLDVTPSERQPDVKGYELLDMREWFGEQHTLSSNAVHLGGTRQNYILCPVVPTREGYPNIVL